MSTSVRKTQTRKQVRVAAAAAEEATPRTQMVQFMAAADTQSVVKPTSRRQPTKQQSASKLVRTPLRKRPRTSLSQRPAHSLLDEIMERDPQSEMLGSQRKVTRTIPESTLHSILKKKKSTSTPELQPYQRSAKSMLRSVSFRDEQLNVPLNDFNVTVDSGGDSSAQWIPNRQRVEAGQSRSPEVNLSISVVSEADGAAQWIPNRERTVRVENDSPAVADFGVDDGMEVGDDKSDSGEINDDMEEIVDNLEEGRKDEADPSASHRSKKPVKQRKSLPMSKKLVRELMMHFSRRTIAKDAVDLAAELVDKFFDQLIDDLECYCLHAKRKTIQKEDFELHLRRVREVHDKKSLDALVLDHLPMEYWRDLLDLPIKKK
ncbi:centromere protein T-like isoform X2 [Corticium candelabrum]|uniref:centromere protein T-like isoform X2 n=1 Tax=Corticium candelabrum TaxID=121492 RepID=UPI002E276778|nr:centromere protein T-like isoform X2 [Corticium candelabrum]